MWAGQYHSTKLPTMSGKRCTESQRRRERPRSTVTTFPRVQTDHNIKPNIIAIASDNRPYAEIEINNHKAIGLLDSGAQDTIMGRKYFTLLKQCSLKRETVLTTVKTADRTPHTVECIFPITSNGWKIHYHRA